MSEHTTDSDTHRIRDVETVIGICDTEHEHVNTRKAEEILPDIKKHVSVSTGSEVKDFRRYVNPNANMKRKFTAVYWK